MAEGLNKVILIGNLGADPELRFTQGGSAVLKIRLATSESYVDRNKERQERTEWHSVVVWGNRAEALNKILAKGRTIGIEGRIQTRSWEDKDNNKRYSTEIVANNVILLGGGSGGGGGSRRSSQGDDDAGGFGSGPSDFPGGDLGDDDIPF
ncbi:MAG: single-stranded DNA-binding protein [Myxococcales bacterium]|nr:single-stranded DNA-binding protein [Myxococcales bacterium]